MSDKIRVNYTAPNEGPYGHTEHETEAEARQAAESFVASGPPDTQRVAYVSRPIATYYMRHSVSSLEYTPIVALSPAPSEGEGNNELNLGADAERALSMSNEEMLQELGVSSDGVFESEPAAEEVGEGSVEMDEPFEAGDETDEDYEPEEIVLSPFRFRDCTFDDKSTPDTITIASSSQHAEESARAQDLPPLFPPEPPQPATPESLMESGAIKGEAYGLWREIAKAGS